MTLLRSSIFALLFLLVPALRAQVVVSNTNDSGSGSLRAAIASGGTVTFAPGMNGQTVVLASELVVGGTVTVDASSLPNGVTVSGQNAHRVFYVTGGNVTLRGLTIANGLAPNGKRFADGSVDRPRGNPSRVDGTSVGTCDSGTSINSADRAQAPDLPYPTPQACAGWNGGGLYAQGGTVILEDVLFSGNQAGDGLEGRVSTTIINSQYWIHHVRRDGGAGGHGGALYVNSGATVVVRGGMFVDNSGGQGGGVPNFSTDRPDESEVIPHGHTAGDAWETWAAGGDGGWGGAIANRGTLTVEGAFFQGNAAGDGGQGGNSTRNGNRVKVGDGGAGGSGGGVYTMPGGTTVLRNATFYSNAPGAGGQGGSHLNALSTTFSIGSHGMDAGHGGSGGDGASLFNRGNTTLAFNTISKSARPVPALPAAFPAAIPTTTPKASRAVQV